MAIQTLRYCCQRLVTTLDMTSCFWTTVDWFIIDVPRPQMWIKNRKWRLSTKASVPFTPEVRGTAKHAARRSGGARCSSNSYQGAFLYLELHINTFNNNSNNNKQRYYLSLEFHIQPQSPCPFGISPETSWLSVEIKPAAKSILSQLMNKSAGDLADVTLKQALKKKATGPGKVSAAPRRVLSPRCLCSVQAHCEFGAAAAAFALFPSAAAPHRLFKTGYGANNLQRKHIYSTFLKKKQRTSARKLALRSGRSYLSGVRPGLASGRPPVQTRQTALLVPPEVREEEPRDVGLAPQPHSARWARMNAYIAYICVYKLQTKTPKSTFTVWLAMYAGSHILSVGSWGKWLN